MRSGSYYIFISDLIIGDVYATERLAHAHFLFSACFESLAFVSQLENLMKLIF